MTTPDFTVAQVTDAPPTIPAIFASMGDTFNTFSTKAERFIEHSNNNNEENK